MRPTFLGFSPASNQQAGLAQTRPDLAQALERVVDKRDAVTRTKALAMVVQLVEDPTAAAPDLDALLEAFAVPFAAVGYDPAWRVRAALHGALGAARGGGPGSQGAATPRQGVAPCGFCISGMG